MGLTRNDKMTTVRRKQLQIEPKGDQLEIEDVRHILSKAEDQAIKERIERAERTLEDLKSLLTHAPLLHNGKLSTGTIDYAAFRVETLSLIFEIAQQTFRKFCQDPGLAYQQFLADLGDEVGLTFARDLLGRLIAHNLLRPFQDVSKLLGLWSSFENDTGAGETEIAQYSPEQIKVRLRNNPLRRAETVPHAHCGFYRNYMTSLINEIFRVRARHLGANLEGATIKTYTAVGVNEEPDADDQCIFAIQCRPEKLRHSFDLLTEAYDQFYKLGADEDFSSCMNKARAALVTAQMEGIGIIDERPPRQLHLVYREMLSARVFKLMDETYQRVSKALHAESRTADKMGRTQAWGLLRDARRSVYAIEYLEIEETKKKLMRDQAFKWSRLGDLEELAEKAKGLESQDRQALRDILARLKKNVSLTEEGQITFVSVLRKIGGKAWDVARPVLSEVLTAAIKQQLNVD
jgi:hypothetical protein